VPIKGGAHVFHEPVIAPNFHISGELWGDYVLSAGSLSRGSSAPDLETFIGGIELPAFAGTGGVSEEGSFSTHILHDLKPNSTMTFHVHWGHNIDSGTYTAGDNSVKWQIECTFAKGYGGVFHTPVTTSSTQSAGAQYEHHITNDDDMTLVVPDAINTIEPDTVVLARIFRDPSEDDFAHDAFLIQADIHYQIGQLGTKERNRPFGGFDE